MPITCELWCGRRCVFAEISVRTVKADSLTPAIDGRHTVERLKWGSFHMAMKEKLSQPSDLFHVIGFSETDVRRCSRTRSLDISEEGFKTVAEINRNSSVLWEAERQGRVVKLLIEVYFLDRRSLRADDAFEVRYGRQFQIVRYYNDTAMYIAKKNRIELPPVLTTIARTDLPKELGTGIRDYYFLAIPG